MKRFLKCCLSLMLVFLSMFTALSVCAQAKTTSINVYNWGEYIPDGSDGLMDVNAEFTRRTGIKVNYTTFDSNEEMFTKISNGGGDYDVIVPSDYMISRMIDEDMLAKLDYSKLPNAREYIDKSFENNEYDKGNVYSVPYQWCYVGILYNTKLVDPEDDVNSWDILWNEKYSGQILMFNNSRDAFGISLARLGYSQNSVSEEEWIEAADELIKQRPLVQAYAMDQIIDKMIAGEAALATYYAGDSLLCQADNPDIAFAVPKDAKTNRFVDAMCILESSTKKDAAHKYLDFICDPEVSYNICQYVEYCTPNTGTFEILKKNDEVEDILYPDEKALSNMEFFKYLPSNISNLESKLWSEIRADTTGSIWQIFAVIGAFILVWLAIVLYKRVIKKRKFT